jgi:hypothetical protein
LKKIKNELNWSVFILDLGDSKSKSCGKSYSICWGNSKGGDDGREIKFDKKGGGCRDIIERVIKRDSYKEIIFISRKLVIIVSNLERKRCIWLI